MSVAPNLAQARGFLARLDPEATLFTLQTFDDSDERRRELARIVHADPANGVLDSMANTNANGAGIFVTINETDGAGRQTHNIKRVRALFVDLDGAPLQPLVTLPLDPHIVVESSPGRYHAYWLCDDCPLDQFERMQRALAHRFKGDPSVHDLPRVMRLPGFYHRKADPFLTHVVPDLGVNAPPYVLAEIVGTLGLDLNAKDARSSPRPAYGERVGEGGRNAHLFALGRSMAKKGLSPEAVRAALTAENAARCDPQLTNERVRYVAGRAFTAQDTADWQGESRRDAGGADIGEGHPGNENAKARDLERRDWPDAMDEAVFHGIAGDFVRMVEPNTEADPAAILVQFLVAFGALVGRGPHYRVEGDEHHPNSYVLLVGATGKGRKGTSWGRVRDMFQRVPDWKPHVSGLSSGEGLKYNVRDAREETKEKRGELVTELVDEGVTDKRLLVIESEFASVLRAAQRHGSTLSATVREGWDSGNLRTLTKHDPVTATGAHICIIGHITADELRTELTATDSANGFANRFLFVAVRRSKLLAFGGEQVNLDELQAFADRLRKRAETARTRERIGMTDTAKAVWTTVYPELSAGGAGLHGAITARAEAQVIRLALVYCLLDGDDAIDVPHLLAAIAVWEYCDATAHHVFGASMGDRTADDHAAAATGW